MIQIFVGGSNEVVILVEKFRRAARGGGAGGRLVGCSGVFSEFFGRTLVLLL